MDKPVSPEEWLKSEQEDIGDRIEKARADVLKKVAELEEMPDGFTREELAFLRVGLCPSCGQREGSPHLPVCKDWQETQKDLKVPPRVPDGPTTPFKPYCALGCQGNEDPEICQGCGPSMEDCAKTCETPCKDIDAYRLSIKDKGWGTVTGGALMDKDGTKLFEFTVDPDMLKVIDEIVDDGACAYCGGVGCDACEGHLEVAVNPLLDFCAEMRDEAGALQARKNRDYGGDDPLGNFRASARIDVPMSTGIFIRLQDKIARLENFIKTGTLAVSEESVKDTVLDIINYAPIFLYALMKELEEDL